MFLQRSTKPKQTSKFENSSIPRSKLRRQSNLQPMQLPNLHPLPSETDKQTGHPLHLRGSQIICRCHLHEEKDVLQHENQDSPEDFQHHQEDNAEGI